MPRERFTFGYRRRRAGRRLRRMGRQLFNILTPWMWPARRRDHETRMINAAMFDKMASRDPELISQAVNEVNDFTRKRMREDGFLKQILPQVSISNEELDRAGWTDKPPAAISIPFDTLPINPYVHGLGFEDTVSHEAFIRALKGDDKLDRVERPVKPLAVVMPDGTMVDSLPMDQHIRGMNPYTRSPEASPRALTEPEKELLRRIRETREEREEREEREGLDLIDE